MTTMADRTEEQRLTLSALVYIVPLALVAAATIVSFGFASFSLLYTAKEMPGGSGIHHRRTEPKPALSGVVPHTHGNTAPLPTETELPNPAADATLRPSPIGTTPTRPIPAEQREQVFREFEMYSTQKVKTDGDNAASRRVDHPRGKR
jgi:hypothetical protein